MHQDGHGKVLTRTLAAAATVLGLVAAAAAVNYYKRKSPSKAKRRFRSNIVPRVFRSESGRIGNVERFSHYVARQLGFDDPNECPQLCKLAYEHLRKSKEIEETIFYFFANEEDSKSLCEKLIEEFDRCILSYFAFHWKQAPKLISQVLNNDDSVKKTMLKGVVMAAMRKQRVEKLTQNLKVTRVFSTLVDEMNAISKTGCTNVTAPMDLCDRSPVLLLMGGGMGAGKSTVIKNILEEPFWSGAKKAAVIVEADAFKERDIIYQALNSMGHSDVVHTAELVHKTSTDAASSLLVTALNEGRDVIMDGTLSWEPFVDETIAMARDVHNRRYRMGAGYKVAEDGTITENYWEREPPNHADDPDEQESFGKKQSRKPYRIELVGVVCDAYLAVVRGIRRAIITGRAVRVSSQLKSHKNFANAFTRYCELVDNARLYCTNAVGGPPSLIAWKELDSKLLIEPEQIKWLNHVSDLNSEAESICELYPEPNLIYEPGTVWSDIVMSSSRSTIQSELKTAIQKIEQYPPPLPLPPNN